MSEQVRKPTKISGRTYDADTLRIDGYGKSFRIIGTDGTEIGSGSDAEFFRDALVKGMFAGEDAEPTVTGIDVNDRYLASVKVAGVDWRHVLYEAGVSTNWGKYGYDDAGSEADNRYKWYSGVSQAGNLEAFELIASDVEPSSIVSDKDYNRLNALRKQFQQHIVNFGGGVGDKAKSMQVVKELFADPDLLSAVQKRDWYEDARGSNQAAIMKARWNDPYTRAALERGERTQTMDVAERVDTSTWGMIKNSLSQQFEGSEGIFSLQNRGVDKTTLAIQELQGTRDGEAEINRFIQQHDVAPDMAAKMMDAYEEDGITKALDLGNEQVIHKETVAQRNAVEKMTGAKYMGNLLLNEGLPYVVNPAGWVASGKVAKGASVLAKMLPASKSTLVNRAVEYGTVGMATGFTESLVYTSNNYKDFTNKELLDIWMMDTGFGAGLGVFGAGLMSGVEAYGKRQLSKVAGEGIEDIDYKPPTDVDQVSAEETAAWKVREEENVAFDEWESFTTEIKARQQELTEEVARDLRNGTTEQLPIVETDDVVPTAKPTPRVEEPTIDSTVEPTDARTPEEIEVDELAWQQENIDLQLEHHQNVVQPKLEEVDKQHNLIARTFKKLTKGIGLQEMATKLIKSTDAKTSFIGTRILETGVGFAGKVKRKATAALIKDSWYTRSVGNLNESYVNTISEWAMSQGAGKYKAFKAAWEGGKVNDTAREFHRAVMHRQEALHMGHAVEPDDVLDKYLTQLNKTNDELFEGRIASNIKGFDAKRRIKNYMPHVWKKVKVGEITNRFGKRAVLELLTESIESAKRAGKIADNTSTTELAERQLNWINGLGDSMEHADAVGAGTSGRGKSRIPLDFTVEKNGISMLDLVDTDIPTVMDSYIQRASADIGISQATDGLIRSEGDFIKFLTPNSDSDKLLAQDTRDLLYGRPTRDGMAPEMRSLMDMVTIQQMGGIGVAQLAETGTMAQRMVVNYMSHPKVAKKLWAMAGESMDDKGVMHQVRSIAAVNDSMEYINRYSVNNIDQAQIDELSAYKAASIDAVDKMTLGSYKAQFGRMLGKYSGVNAVQKAQSRLLQASFSVDIARAAKFGKGTSTQARLADLGLTEGGKVFDNIKKHVEFDGDEFPSNFNFDKWDRAAKDEFVYAMNREEAQLMPRVMSGELPVFMNKPLWQAIMQFRKTPLAFMSKGAQRNLQFADREAVFGTVLNAMTAGVSRYAKVSLAGGAYYAISDEEFKAPTFDQAKPYNYVSNFGALGDGYSLYQPISKAWQEKDGWEALQEGARQVPVWSGINSAMGAIQGDPKDIKSSTPLNSLPLVTEVTNAVIRNMEKN